MALTKEQKEDILKDLQDKLSKKKALVFVDYTGLKVKDLSELRKKLRKEDSLFRVSKKTLLKLALKKTDPALVEEVDKMEGQLGLVFGFGDVIAPNKAAYNLSKENENLKILGGFFEGKFIGEDVVAELANIPSREELLARLVGSISAPVSNLVYVLQGNIKGLLFTLSAIKK